MKSNDKEYENIDNKDVEVSENSAADGAHAASGEAPADNMAEASDTMAQPEEPATPELTPEEEAAIWKDKFVRLSAEYDNYRKRSLKEKLDLINTGGEDVVRSMLDVLDDMDRALEAISKTDDLEAVKQGIVLIDNKLRGALRSKGLSEIEAVGSELDTDLHEAIARIETDDRAMKGKIIDVVQKGYKLKDKIIRYAKVVVGQ
jgi:molecular chaperone GrpE